MGKFSCLLNQLSLQLNLRFSEDVGKVKSRTDTKLGNLEEGRTTCQTKISKSRKDTARSNKGFIKSSAMKILYDDGDKEQLNLKKQRWELVDVNVSQDEEEEFGLQKLAEASAIKKKTMKNPNWSLLWVKKSILYPNLILLTIPWSNCKLAGTTLMGSQKHRKNDAWFTHSRVHNKKYVKKNGNRKCVKPYCTFSLEWKCVKLIADFLLC